MVVFTEFKRELTDRASRWEIASPDRREYFKYGGKQPKPLSQLLKRIHQADSRSELNGVLRGIVVSEREQSAAIRRSRILEAQAMPSNREVVFRIDWDEVKRRPEDANIAKLCILEFLSRMTKDMQNVRCKQVDFSKVHFVAIPEIWSSGGMPSPLHYHMMLWVESSHLDWFDKRAHRVWQQVITRYGQRGRLHVDAINSRAALARYTQKQGDIDWVFEHTLTPVDLEKYRGSAQLA